jgi:hypothetical protein
VGREDRQEVEKCVFILLAIFDGHTCVSERFERHERMERLGEASSMAEGTGSFELLSLDCVVCSLPDCLFLDVCSLN